MKLYETLVEDCSVYFFLKRQWCVIECYGTTSDPDGVHSLLLQDLVALAGLALLQETPILDDSLRHDSDRDCVEHSTQGPWK